MDLLAKRYASPFIILEEFIRQGRLFEFVTEVNTLHNDDQLWEIWLYKLSYMDNRSFAEWKKSLHIPDDKNQDIKKSDLEATVKNSINILNGFIP